MARKFDLGMAIVAGLVIFVALTGSGCLDENPIDTASDDTLEDITDGEMTDASGTMESTLFKMAEEASGGYEPVPVAENVQVELLDDGSISPYDIDNLPENLRADVALDAYTHPEKYFSIIELPNGNLKIIGLQELNGWKIDTSPKIRQYGEIENYGQVVENGYNDNIFGNNEKGKTKTVNTNGFILKGNPCGNEISAFLSENDNDDTILTVLYGPGWEDNKFIIVDSADPRVTQGFWSQSSECLKMNDDGSVDIGYHCRGIVYAPEYCPNVIEVNEQTIFVSSANLGDLLEKRADSHYPGTEAKNDAYVFYTSTAIDELYQKGKVPVIVVSKSS